MKKLKNILRKAFVISALTGIVLLGSECREKTKPIEEPPPVKIVEEKVLQPVYYEVPKGVYTRWQVADLLMPDKCVGQKRALYKNLTEWNNGQIEYRPGEKIIIGME